jgi:DNA polymerase I-like protein with 3'-5' exonuclease and polymerase domains
MIERVTSAYEHALQSCYWDIGNRGIRVLQDRLDSASAIVEAEIKRNLAIATNQWGCPVFVGAANAPKIDADNDLDDEDEDEEEDEDWINSVNFENLCGSPVNLNSSKGKYALVPKLKELGYNVPKITKKDQEGNYDSRYSAGELAIQKMLAENQFNYTGGDPALRAILKIRELQKLKTSYLTARLYRSTGELYFLTNYNVAGTLSGRRSSRRHTFGFGNNAQNFPKHSKVASLFRRCLVSRPGNIFLLVDQIQAEDWPVSALSANVSALQELRSGVDRHSKLASAIWGHRVPAKTDPDWNDALYDQERYIGKKARHANNYGMKEGRFQDVLAQEASLTVSLGVCKQILDAVNKADPSVKGVFHKYVQDMLSATRVLITPKPFQRERQFLSLRPNDYNGNAIKEAFAFIPQSTVGDNTGFAILKIETQSKSSGYIVQEGHDSIIQDIPDRIETIYDAFLWTLEAFNRKIKFHNGIEIEIPIEAELAYDLATSVKIKEFSLAGVRQAREKLMDKLADERKLEVVA